MSSPLDQRISIITIAVNDVDESRQFYNQVFGWTPDEADEEEAANIAFYTLNGFKLALYPLTRFADEHNADVQGPGGFTLAYNVNTEAEVDRLFARFAEHDVSVLKAPEKVFWGGYSGYIAGPSGEQWEIAFNPFTVVNPDGTFG
jgi:catechol 2,3-dioxygenase-like lactoylglutathione lyase family enzyme